MTRLDFYNRFKEVCLGADWSLDLYTGINIGVEGNAREQSYCFSDPHTEGLYQGYRLAMSESLS